MISGSDTVHNLLDLPYVLSVVNILHEGITKADYMTPVRIENHPFFTSAIRPGVEAKKRMLDDVDSLTKTILLM